VRFKLSPLILFFVFSLRANAEILVNPPTPYPQYLMGNSSIIYYAGNLAGVPSTANSMNETQGYRFIETDSTAASELIYLDVSTNSTALTLDAGQSIAVTLRPTGATNQIVLTGAAVTTGAPTACSATNCISGFDGAYYTAGTVLRLSFSVSALCNAGGSGSLCTGSAVQETALLTKTQNIEVYFGVITTGTSSGDDVVGAAKQESDSIDFGITDINPTISCPSGDISQYYFPGDGQIYLYSNNFGASANGGVNLQYLLAMALEGSATAADFQSNGLGTNTISHYAPASRGTETITGFTNTTTGSDYVYGMVVQSQNMAGLVSATKCDFPSPYVQSQDISGVLKASKCFIATAAYQDGRAAPVMMLRKFRDQILSQYSLGRNFIHHYYHYSPALAEWAWDKPIVRSFALKLLAPIELMAWLILKVSNAQDVSIQEDAQPYIDRVKKSLPPENEVQGSESFLDREKKKIEQDQDLAVDANEPYIERLKKKFPDDQKVEVSAEGYSEKEKSKLPAVTERESPITMVKEGRDRKLDFGETPDIHNAAGIKIGVTPGIQVTVEGGTHTFNDVYGTGFQPELMFHYERQFFHSENFGSFGVGTDFGLAYSGAKGLMQFNFNGSNKSITGFSFMQFPVLFNAIYRFNLLRVLRPYVSAGAGAIGYLETREDAKADKRGYSAVYNGSLGVSILLDFLDSSTHRDSYLASGFQHTYLFIEYLYLNSFKSSVMFRRAGIYSGFLFEF
jgi:hypothetical protein